MPKSDNHTFILNHPLIQHKLTHLRDEKTPTPVFRQLLKEISLLMGYEVTRYLKTVERRIETPLASCIGHEIRPESIVITPVLRAGLGMVDGLLELIPSAYQGHIGVFRDPTTHRPVEYLVKLPSPKGRVFFLVDPMLATGNSAVAAVDSLLKHGVDVSKIKFMALVAAPEGVRVFNQKYDKIPIYTAALDEKLNEKAYILPGLGDAGDRLFGTL